jgi:hypothetical protein
VLNRPAGLLLLLAVGACSGLGGLEDPLRVRVDDGTLAMISCSEGDALRSVRLLRPDDQVVWAADDGGTGLDLSVPRTLEDVATSGDYRTTGSLRALIDGDRVVIDTDRDSRVISVGADREQLNDELSC